MPQLHAIKLKSHPRYQVNEMSFYFQNQCTKHSACTHLQHQQPSNIIIRNMYMLQCGD